MKILSTELDGCLLLKKTKFDDNRGFFQEIFVRDKFESMGIIADFMQDNLSLSKKGVIRGMHFQLASPQGKLVTVFNGEIFDVMLDIRPNSTTFGKWQSINLSAASGDMLWIPPGFAHGFQALSNETMVFYKTTSQYDPAAEKCFNALDPALKINWPLSEITMSEKDTTAPLFARISQQL